MTAPELMTPEEIHDFGIEIVTRELRKEGHEIISFNAGLRHNPQIIARINGNLAFIAVRTALYPEKGEIENQEMFDKLVRHADQHNAISYFASVGIAQANVESEEQMSVPIRGAGYYVAYEGLLVMTYSDRYRVWNEDDLQPFE